MTKRLNLEIFDPTGGLLCTHHLDYVAGTGKVLVLTMKDGKQVLDYEVRQIQSESSKHMFFKASRK